MGVCGSRQLHDPSVPDRGRKLLPDPTQLPRRLKEFPWKWELTPAVKKTRIMGLPDCQNSFKIGLTILTVTQQRRVTDRHGHRCTYTLRLSVWRLSVAYIVPKPRIERPRKTKIGTEVAHITRDSDTTFKVKGQGHRAALLTAVLAREPAAAMGVRTCWPWETAATMPPAQPREVFRRQWGKRRAAGAYRGGCPPTACLY